jgi:hypothetical protein
MFAVFFSSNTFCRSAITASSTNVGAGCSAAPLAKCVSWEPSPFVAALMERRAVDERCEAWVANLLLTFAVGAVVLLRIWWTCGDLPPSDSHYEPALGRVIHSAEDDPESENTGTGGPTPFSFRGLSSRADERAARCRPAVRAPLPNINGAIASHFSTTSAHCLCLSPYLPANTPSASASLTLRPAGTASEEWDGEAEDAEHGIHTRQSDQVLWRKVWSRVLACGTVRGFWEQLSTLRGGVLSLLHSCTTALKELWMPFTVLPLFSLTLRDCGQRLQLSRPQLYAHHPHHAADSKQADELPDISDEEQEELLVEQEELWSILEGIERRRRALTGRNLFRRPLPPRRQRRLERTSASCAQQSWRGDVESPACAANAAAALPILATGVPLDFSTDRKARPVLMDRRGRWIPVAVTDEDGEYYNYNLDLVLPQD